LRALLDLLGPGAGVPTLQALCPGMARGEVRDLLHRYRRAWDRRHRRRGYALRWRRSGSVWATDFAEPPEPVDGTFGRLLAVRDLASGQQLAWLPAGDETGRTARDALEALFREHGPPLVLKSDNGSAFIAAKTAAFLARWQVWHLRSPPDLPEYNGSCEAGIGSMKTRTHHRAACRGGAGAWTCDDVEGARLEANRTARPWGPRGPTPEEVWQHRRLVTPPGRTAFGVRVRQFLQEMRQPECGGKRGRIAAEREALARALLTSGLLEFREGRPIRMRPKRCRTATPGGPTAGPRGRPRSGRPRKIGAARRRRGSPDGGG
jgi:hypothetical protein